QRMPLARSAGHVSGATTAYSTKPGPNQVAESRVATLSKASPVAVSTATIGRPARAHAPRWTVVQAGGASARATLSRSGLGATSHAARPAADARAQRPAPAGAAPGPRSSRWRATTLATRGSSQSGRARAAASGVGKPGGGVSAGAGTPNAVAASRRPAAGTVGGRSPGSPRAAAGPMT